MQCCTALIYQLTGWRGISDQHLMKANPCLNYQLVEVPGAKVMVDEPVTKPGQVETLDNPIPTLRAEKLNPTWVFALQSNFPSNISHSILK